MGTSFTPALVEQLFAAFGGATELAKALSTSAKTVPVQTVHSWKTNGVPEWRREPIVRNAIERAISLSTELLDYLDPDRAVAMIAIASSPEELAAKGIAESAAHAEAVREGWGEDAYNCLVDYVARTPDEFLGEELKAWAYDNGLDKPANEGAWGSVLRRASRAKLIEMIGYRAARNASRHGTPSRLWRRR